MRRLLVFAALLGCVYARPQISQHKLDSLKRAIDLRAGASQAMLEKSYKKEDSIQLLRQKEIADNLTAENHKFHSSITDTKYNYSKDRLYSVIAGFFFLIILIIILVFSIKKDQNIKVEN